MDISLKVNDHTHQRAVDPRIVPCAALREHPGLTGARKGGDQGRYGACILLIEGKRALCCFVLAAPAGLDPAVPRPADGRLVAPDGTAEPLDRAMTCVTAGAPEGHADHIPEGLPPDSMDQIYAGPPPILRGQQRKDVRAYVFGARLVELRVHRLGCEIPVPRMVGAFASGTIVNPPTGRSRYPGGMIRGPRAALEEKTGIDLRHAHPADDNIAEYHIAVNAVVNADVVMIPEQDRQANPLGIGGIGEIGIVGMNAAIAKPSGTRRAGASAASPSASKICSREGQAHDPARTGRHLRPSGNRRHPQR